jgi:hypothetical protein
MRASLIFFSTSKWNTIILMGWHIYGDCTLELRASQFDATGTYYHLIIYGFAHDLNRL